MGAAFLKIINMSITASWVILAVILVRFLLKKAPKWIPCILWALVAIRLVSPFSLESTLSLIPSAEVYPIDSIYSSDPQIANNPYNWKANTGFQTIDYGRNNTLLQDVSTGPVLRSSLNILGYIWLVGIAAFLLYALISYIKLKKSVGASVPVRNNIFACDEIKSPFILGIIKPLIYIPSSMDGELLNYVITHESAHIRRHDHWWKPLGFLLLAVYWFNPLCWIAYILLCRDIEMACDEKVIRDMDKNSVAAYSQALLDCSLPRRRIDACPLAFGETGVKERVKSVLNYKKPAFWIVVIALAACIVVCVCFGTNPAGTVLTKWNIDTVDMNKALADVSSLSVQYLDSSFDCNDSEINRFLATMGKIKVSRKPISISRDEGRSAVFTITVNEHLKLNFNEKFNEIWVDNGVKPSYTFKITNPTTAEELLLDFNFTAGLAPDSGNAEEPENREKHDERPLLVIDGKKYMDPYKPESTLPYGYLLAGTLTAEQAYNTGLEGTQFFTNPNEPHSFYTYQLCGTPTSIDEVDSENRTWQYLRWISVDADALKERKLTLDDVRWLAQKGETLSWDDFEAYPGTRIYSDPFTMQYIIDDLFDVLIGGKIKNAEPEYVRLRNRDINAWVDIRTDDIDAFIKVYTAEHYTSVIDSASFDIDNDGIIEYCTMTYGPTSGLYTVVITAFVDENTKYKNTFNLGYGEVSFGEIDGSIQFVRDGEYYRLYVKDNRIIIEGLFSQYEGYWGNSEWNYDLK